MKRSKEQQGEIRKPSSVISAKKKRKPTEWERLEISSRKLGNISCKDGHNKGQKQYGQKQNTQNYKKKVLMTWISMMV